MTNGVEPERYVLVFSDTTRAREVQTELLQQERLAAVGQLAAGIAHDFNNVLAVIVLYAQMDAALPDLPDRLSAHLKTIGDEAAHASHLIQQILDFSRRKVSEPSPLDLVPLFQERVRLLGFTLPESIKIEYIYPPGEVLVEGDLTRMQQMIVNLAVNARDAMPEGGVLSLTLEMIEVGHHHSPLLGVEPGTWVKVTVADTGTGISAENRAHLFEPFFTTKEPGSGTGLGLAQVYGIVKQHGGQIGVKSGPDRGTTFTIYLPALVRAPLEALPISSPTLPKGSGELILIVEDNAPLRAALVSTLEGLNYRVLEASNGREAVAIVARRGDELDLILSDMVMPEMGGEGLFHTLLESGRADLPMVIMTGHAAGHKLAAMRAEGLAGWLTKPPVVSELAETLARALQGHSIA